MDTTWDGLPIAPDNPRGAGVVVRRDGAYLLLHRHHNGPSYEGDWAWTSPSGARLPGEPILAGAERELHEEAGLSGLDLRPVDLSGGWAVFAAAAPPLSTIVIDAEHDRYEWLSYADAVARLAPASVVDNFTRGAGLPLPVLSLRPLTYDDLAVLVSWFALPHVAPWYPGPSTVDAAVRKYGPRIDGGHPVRCHILDVDGAPAAFLQCSPAPLDPGLAPPDPAETFESFESFGGEVAIDFLIGSPEWIGKGLGPQAIWAYLRDVVLPLYPSATHVVADPSAGNLRSIRALEKAGFVRRGTLFALDRARVFG
jgi:RimJ/RimL family protein N-acetyltransferase/8-oxo-dGTP pyrophosphatase MutT (NUDIX family)